MILIRKDLSEKVIRGRTENALKCKFNGGTLPIGYIIDEEQHFQIDPLTAPFVLDVFKKYDKGATMKELRDWLNENGIRNKLGKPLNFNSIQHMLSNRRYIGEYKYRDITVPDGIPAIVPEDLFDRVQEKLAQNRKAPARHKAEDDYLLTTKLFCGYCGAYLCGESGKSRNGTVHHYYKCVSVKKKRTDCKKKPVRKQWLEDLVVNEVMKVVMDDKAIEAIVSMVMDLQDRENTSLPLYEQQLQEAQRGIDNLLNAIQQGGHPHQVHQKPARGTGSRQGGFGNQDCQREDCEAQNQPGVRNLLAPQIPQAGCTPTVPPQNADRRLCERHLPVR